MPDVFDHFDTLPREQQELSFAVLERKDADPDQQAILASYLTEITFPEAAKVLEIGSGTGAVSRVLARWPGVGEVVGIDPWASFVAKACKLATGLANLTFQQADGHALPFDDGSFDVVVFHTTLTHMQDPRQALEESYRVLRPGGWLSVFDWDTMANSYAIGANDPLQVVYLASVPLVFQNPWIARKLPGLLTEAGFVSLRARSYSSVSIDPSEGALGYADTWIDIVARTGIMQPVLAEALKEETRQRAAAGTYFEFTAAINVIARKTADPGASTSARPGRNDELEGSRATPAT